MQEFNTLQIEEPVHHISFLTAEIEMSKQNQTKNEGTIHLLNSPITLLEASAQRSTRELEDIPLFQHASECDNNWQLPSSNT